ncbi:WD40 repeat protein [Saccharothrix tamanrassetensis]|uniref:WD40 repeat protein n=1 Tax=Saccharothrix tamanrassetensis TaxID=1051531 RepID=A0A841CCT8_9PSEU|nr:trypsin-like peptidase domain-containing protein [Saccharothrix tamanrassetensis]MBB5955061.1 WD40 repeat protein [Saccharothrix tamanrassetensis]
MDGSGHIVGTGVVVSRTHVLTCAHVVNLALGREPRATPRPADPVPVEFPALPGLATPATVHSWTPPPPREGVAGDDICVLSLDVPAIVTPAKLINTPPRAGHPVDVFGFPANRPDGAWVRAVVRGQVSGRLLQLDSESALRVQPGYSGGPVWDPETGRVVGIIATAAGQDSYAIPADRLRTASPDRPPVRRGDRISLLHLASTRFGADERWFGPLHGSLADARPDLVVFSGDLTEGGKPSEVDRGFRFLAQLAEAVELPRERVVVVPGASDVNRLACQAYFAQEEALERLPVPPYWPKWAPFAAAFDEFYDGKVTFTPDEPWTLFEVPDLFVVVAGLNSTFHDSHLTSKPGLGAGQAERFTALLRDYRLRGWLRLGAAHRWPGDPGLADRDRLSLCLTGDGEVSRMPTGMPVVPVADSSYQLITLHPMDITRTVRRWQGGWVDVGTEHMSAEWESARATFTLVDAPRVIDRSSNSLRGTFFERVHEATVVSQPTATVTPRADQSYLRVSKPREGGGFEQWPVGVAGGPVSEEDVDRFIVHVHNSFAAADPSVPSEIVYSGPPAAPEVVLSAQRRGVRLRSFVEYQGLLDLRSLADRQAQRLASDPVYPAELYVPQRFAMVGSTEVKDDVLGQVIDWLGREAARFVMVLGDFGRGKSFLLRQLTRQLPEHLPGLLPVLVELRSLEKAPTLDELLAQHLVREGVEAVDVAKLRYMISSGRLALLFDGFDELELRVGYDNAADYLGVLLHAVTDRAKVVLTSRTQHFRSTNQVLTALGQQVSALTASRGVVLEDFTDDQILDFLTRHYLGDADRAAKRFALLGAISDLLGLSRNPRMLSFIADLDEDRLLEVRREHGRISAAELYRELVDFWLVHEAERQRHRYGTPSFDDVERLAACTSLAQRLWETTSSTIRTTDLAETVVTTLTRLAERGYSIDQAAHAVGSGTLLVRTEDGGFAFVHQSVMEWLVAKVAADDLLADRLDTAITQRKMSKLMVDFFCDLAGHQAAVRWARAVLADLDAGDVAKRNATAVVQRLDTWARLELSGVDLRANDLSTLDLRGANLSGADLSGQRLVNKDLSGANLANANLTDVRMFGGDLTGATLTGSRWHRAALLGVTGTEHGELADAAVSGRDRVAAMVAPLAEDVSAVAFSPDGELVALARVHGVELRDTKTNKPVRFWRGHANPVEEIAYSPNGRLVATVESDGRAYLWDAMTGEPRAEIEGLVRGRIAFLADRVHLVGLGVEGEVRFWVVRTGALRDALAGRFERLAVASNGVWLATAAAGGVVQVWALDGHETHQIRVDSEVHRLALFDDTTVAVGSEDGAVEIVDTASGMPVARVATGHGPIEDLAFSPDGTLLATTGQGADVAVWDMVTGVEVTSFSARLGVGALVFAPDGKRIAVAVEDGSAFLHHIPDGNRLGVLSTEWRGVGAVSFTRNGAALATSCDGLIRLWDTRTGVARRKSRIVDRDIRQVRVSPDGTRAVTTTTTGVAKVWPLREVGESVRIGDDVVHAVAFSPDGERIATWHERGRLRTWYSRTGALLTSTSAPGLATAYVLAYSPNGRRIVSGHVDGTARVWGGQHPVVLGHHDLEVETVAYSADGRHIATGSTDGNVKIWTTRGHLLTTISIQRSIWAVAFSPNGERVAAASSDGFARVWSVNGELLLTLTGHTTLVRDVAFSPDGEHIATAAEDGTARIWDAGTGAEVATLVHSGDGEIVLLPDGSYKNENGLPVDDVFWSIKQCRFGEGELDAYYPHIRQLSDDAPIPVTRQG